MGRHIVSTQPVPYRNTTRGWCVIVNHTKSHYYVDGVSLCGRLHVSEGTPLFNGLHDVAQNCAICQKKRERLYPEEK